MMLKEISECSGENQFADKKGIRVVKYVAIRTRSHTALSVGPENCTWVHGISFLSIHWGI